MKYSVNNVAWFFSKEETPDLWPLSNMAGGMPIYLGKNKFHSSEQLYQACKYLPGVVCIPESISDQARGAYEPRVQKRILESNNARGAKMTQKCAVKAGLIRADWDKIKVDCMLWVLELKLKWNPDTFGAVLKSTGSKMIVEKSKKDTFWGCIQKGSVFDGDNQLGRLLVHVRSNYARIVNNRILTHPDGFLILP
jgi:N-glycosidase YbiA